MQIPMAYDAIDDVTARLFFRPPSLSFSLSSSHDHILTFKTYSISYLAYLKVNEK